MKRGLIRELFDFLVPPNALEKEKLSNDMMDFERVMKDAQGWRELRMLVDVIEDQLDSAEARKNRDSYATFVLDRENKYMLIGVRSSDDGSELHITQQVMHKFDASKKRERMRLKLMFEGLEDAGAKPKKVMGGHKTK